MHNHLRLGAVLLALGAWVAMAYAVRYGLMEHTRWVGACALNPQQLPCRVRAGMGQMIHWNVLPLLGLMAAVAAWLTGGRRGRCLAALGVALAIPGLVLYTTSLAGLVVMAAGLRWVKPCSPALE
jgi:hypothetical protein